ncbi:MAG: ATP-binding protein [Proteobacteria bacterium]|nr:ATP-binding protein [Pseudomonadota bacterium]
MTKTTWLRPNLLGDLRAEADAKMLQRAFIETSDYRTLIETSDKVVVVGRRGTGKSALSLSLLKYWEKVKTTHVLELAPEEHQIISVRPVIALFGTTFSMVRAGSKLLWRYALIMELATLLLRHTYSDDHPLLREHTSRWTRLGPTVFDRFRCMLKMATEQASTAEERIGNLPILLDLTKIEQTLTESWEGDSTLAVLLFDRLDEGYVPDNVGVGFVDGLVQAAIDVKTRFPFARPVVFLRDNIFRAVEKLDPDYSRNIEGHVLRIHWSESALFDFATKRLKVAFGLPEESSQRIWNTCTADDLKDFSGFVKCLQQTLYRPRDLLSLLNDSFYVAAGQEHRTHIALTDILVTAQHISDHRFSDLQKEYDAIIPGLGTYMSVFRGHDPERPVQEVADAIECLLISGSEDSRVQQEVLILEDAKSVVRALYSVGFVGVRDTTSGKFVFCHDGRAPDREFTVGDKVLVHPCYWMALNCTRDHLTAPEAQDIYDEYDIEVASETPAIRRGKISSLIAQLDAIPLGPEGETQFEQWCYKAIRICFAKGLRNVELKPNKLARQRRDVVATNFGERNVWRRIYEDYQARQVVFEIKNYDGISAADYQQVVSYLSGEYGRIAFIVTRDDSVDLRAHRDVEWVRDIHAEHRKLIIKLTGKYFTNLLYKLRNPEKHEEVDDALHKILDTYVRLYLAGQTKGEAAVAKHRQRKERRVSKRAMKTLPELV